MIKFDEQFYHKARDRLQSLWRRKNLLQKIKPCILEFDGLCDFIFL